MNFLLTIERKSRQAFFKGKEKWVSLLRIVGALSKFNDFEGLIKTRPTQKKEKGEHSYHYRTI